MKGYSDLVIHSGNRPLVEALEASLVSLLAGRPIHVHVEGLRGTGKTTIIRAMRDVLPAIERVAGCPYNCDPSAPHCPEHRTLPRGALESLGTEMIRVPFLEISHAAKTGTVVGSIDLARIADPTRPEAALLPGILPRASRGIVFVDEINRLADTSPELTDILLDVMGTKPGRLQIEETGLPSFEIPIACCVWAASNPDEEPGALEDIRRQLSDRFDFTVNMGRPQDHASVKRILTEEEPRAGRPDGRAGTASCQASEARMKLLMRASAAFGGVALPDELASILAEMYVDFGMESLRAVEAIALGARARAALDSRAAASLDDVRTVLPFALRHRVDASTLMNIAKFLDEYELRRTRPREPEPDADDGPASVGARTAGAAGRDASGDALGCSDAPARPEGLWGRLMRGMGFARGEGRAHDASGRAGDDPGGVPTVAQRGASGGVDAGGSAISDPTTTPICAPPGRARALSQLSADELVVTEDDLRP